MAERWVVEGEWSGYRSGQRRICHRTVESAKFAERVKNLGWIRFGDGTTLDLRVRKALHREKVEVKRGYCELISDCLRENVHSVDELAEVRKARAMGIEENQ